MERPRDGLAAYSAPVREIHDLEAFDRHCRATHRLDGIVVQGVDLSERDETLRSISCVGATFLGCRIDGDTLAAVLDGGAVVFPNLPALPFRPYRPTLYTQGELLEGWNPDRPGSFGRDSRDSRIYAWASQYPHGTNLPVVDSLAQRLHDHAIDDAMAEYLASLPASADVVAVMGGHALRRTEPLYRTVVELGRAMTREGWHVATGGGPGAMEAANLGAWLATVDDGEAPDAIDRSIELLSAETDYAQADDYLRAGESVLDEFPDGAESLAVPTWFYGHEPTNQFATHIAKYFANSIREDGLLAIATRGVVFAPGAAGTTQEVFQDATQNHYTVFGTASPMVFLDSTFWRERLPAEPLLRTLAGDRPYASLIGSVDTAVEAIAFLRDHPPVDVG